MADMWAVYSILTAVTWATSDLFAKQAMDRGVSGPRMAFLRLLVAVPMLLPALLRGIPPISETFWLTHLPWLPLETAATYLYFRAVRLSPLSLTLPFMALTPGFLVFTGWLFLGEAVDATGLVGIGLIVGGSYVINLPHATRGDLLGPFKAIAREPGSRYMAIAAAVFSLTAICGKVLVQESSPSYFAVHYLLIMAVVLAPAGLRRSPTPEGRDRPVWPLIVLCSVFFALMTLFQMLALNEAVVAYMIALKRCAGIIGVLYGWLILKERDVKHRLVGSAVMVAGGTLIVAG